MKLIVSLNIFSKLPALSNIRLFNDVDNLFLNKNKIDMKDNFWTIQSCFHDNLNIFPMNNCIESYKIKPKEAKKFVPILSDRFNGPINKDQIIEEVLTLASKDIKRYDIYYFDQNYTKFSMMRFKMINKNISVKYFDMEFFNK